MESEIIQLYNDGYSIIELSKIFHKRESFVSNLLKNNNIVVRKNIEYIRKHFVIDEKYFENINSEDKAYFLGLIIADGSVHNYSGKYMKIALQEEDCKVLEILSNKIYGKMHLNWCSVPKKPHHKRQKVFTVNSEKIFDDLGKLFVIPRKTFVSRFPYQINENLYRYLIKGLSDGDGCITKSVKNYRWALDGTYELLNFIKIYLKNELQIHSSLSKLKNIYQLNINGNLQVFKFLKWMYQDSTIHFDRKYQKFLDLDNKLSLDYNGKVPEGRNKFNITLISESENKKYGLSIPLNGKQKKIGRYEKLSDAIRFRDACIKFYNLDYEVITNSQEKMSIEEARNLTKILNKQYLKNLKENKKAHNDKT